MFTSRRQQDVECFRSRFGRGISRCSGGSSLEVRPWETEATMYSVPLDDIDGRLAITLRPRGGDWLSVELQRLRREGVEILVSALTEDEQRELGLAEEPQLAAAHGMEFV